MPGFSFSAPLFCHTQQGYPSRQTVLQNPPWRAGLGGCGDWIRRPCANRRSLGEAGWLLRDAQAAGWQMRGHVRYRVNPKARHIA